MLKFGGLFVFAFLAVLAGCAAPPAGDSVERPVETSIQAIAADPAGFHGKFVRVRGVLDRCMSRGGSCGLAQAQPGALPDSPKAAHISVRFGNEDASSAGDGDFRVIVGRAMDRLYRFSEVTLVGRYKGSCASGRDLDHPQQPGAVDEIVACYDGYGTGLAVARVLAVHKRWPATAFRLEDDADDPLEAAQPEIAGKVLKTYLDTLLDFSTADIDELKASHRVFIRTKFTEAAEICFCRNKQCLDQWPAFEAQVISAPANPYYCIPATLAQGTWHFDPTAHD